MNYPRRQQYRRVRRAAAAGATSVLTAGLALLAASLGASGRSRSAAIRDRAGRLRTPLGASRGPQPGGRPFRGPGSAHARAASSGGMAAAPLTSVARPWGHRQRGDLAHRHRVRNRNEDQRFEAQHVALVMEIAASLRRRRRRWSRKGALPVLCVVHASRLERVEAGVLIVSLDRLVAALRTAAGTRERPAFLSPIP